MFSLHLFRDVQVQAKNDHEVSEKVWIVLVPWQSAEFYFHINILTG